MRRVTSSLSGSMSGWSTISCERQVGKLAFGGDAFALRAGGDSGQLVAGLLFVGFGEEFAEVGEMESLDHRWRLRLGETMLSKNMLSKSLRWGIDRIRR